MKMPLIKVVELQMVLTQHQQVTQQLTGKQVLQRQLAELLQADQLSLQPQELSSEI